MCLLLVAAKVLFEVVALKEKLQCVMWSRMNVVFYVYYKHSSIWMEKSQFSLTRRNLEIKAVKDQNLYSISERSLCSPTIGQ